MQPLDPRGRSGGGIMDSEPVAISLTPSPRTLSMIEGPTQDRRNVPLQLVMF